MIGNGGASMPPRQARLDDRFQRFGTIAPYRVHLKVAAVLGDLVDQLARWTEHQRLHAQQRRLELLQQSQSERHGLAAAGRRLHDQVARHGHDDAVAAQRAYALGLADVLPAATIAYAPPSAWMAALDRAPVSLDELADRSRLPVAALSSMLLVLELEGVVSAASGGRYVLARPAENSRSPLHPGRGSA